ncbi:MAG: hypothetical protein Solivirus8_4 [Solivirus sp.]|uniref:Uncharacterized protein n=1 Tax=Solivirus sp. TaxID=2487772 RepID=A0A3G5AG71_9VIRU|nr:MAG: hypothetical protein Solivirus8_4 [Solivirus sp.]
MSLVKVIPTKWTINEEESKVQIYGRLMSGRTFYAETKLQNYLLVLYLAEFGERDFEQEHLFYQNHYPIYLIKKESHLLYRFYVADKKSRRIVEEMIKLKRFMKIVNGHQELLSKFFIENNILPGNSQFLYNPEVLLNGLSRDGFDMSYSFTGISSFYGIEMVAMKSLFLTINRTGDKIVSISLSDFITSPADVTPLPCGTRNIFKQASDYIFSYRPDYLIGFDLYKEIEKLDLPPSVALIDLKSYIEKEVPELVIPTQENLFKKYSINRLEQYWNMSIEFALRSLANFWKMSIESVLRLTDKELMNNLIFNFTSVPPPQLQVSSFSHPQRHPGDSADGLKGLYSTVCIYSLSTIYLSNIVIIDALTDTMKKYFDNTKRGRVLYESGFCMTTTPNLPVDTLWFDKDRIWLLCETPTEVDLIKIDTARVTISTKSYFYYLTNNLDFDIGDRSLLIQPFRLINKYINHIIQFIKEHPNQPIVFPTFDQQLYLGDLEMIVRIYPEYDYSGLNEKLTPFLKSIIDQMRESGKFKPKGVYEDIKYIMTLDGPLIESIYSRDLPKYSQRIAFDFYDKIRMSTLAELDENN